jgi:DMSO/TMAO reductase YedYZ molybdopterin-dependent catalytic subunit
MMQAEPATDGRAPAAAPDGPPAQAAHAAALPPGQHIPRVWPVMHYGPVPRFRPESWDLRVCGATACGGERRWDWAALSALPRVAVTADMHCVTKFTITDVAWEGISAAELLLAAPPAPEVTHVMVWADYGYSANLPIGVFADDLTLLATHRDGAELAPEHGYPVRLVVPRRYGWKSVKWVRAVEYLTVDRRGFWEERGYHNTADPWREQRFSYQEEPGEGPLL